MKSFSSLAVLALLSGSALANKAINARATGDESVDLAARAEIDDFVNKFKGFTDDEKSKIKDTLTTGFKKLGDAKKDGHEQGSPKKGGPKNGGAKKPAPQGQNSGVAPQQQSSTPKRAAPGKAPAPPPPSGKTPSAPGKGPAPPSGRPGPGAAGLLGGAGAAAGANVGLKKLLNGTEGHRQHNGTFRHHGDRQNATRERIADSILTNLFGRSPAAPGKAPAPPKGGVGRGAAGILGGAGAAAGANVGLKKLLNETEGHHRHRNGTRHHKGDRHNNTHERGSDNSRDSILTNLLERSPAKSGSSSGVGSAVAGGVASGAASAGLSNLLSEIESHLKRRAAAESGDIDDRALHLTPEAEQGPDQNVSPGANFGGLNNENPALSQIEQAFRRDAMLQEIETYLRRRRLAEEVVPVVRRALDNHDAYFANLLATRSAGAMDDLD